MPRSVRSAAVGGAQITELAKVAELPNGRSRNRVSAGHSRVEGRLTRGDSVILRHGELRTTAPGPFHALARPTG